MLLHCVLPEPELCFSQASSLYSPTLQRTFYLPAEGCCVCETLFMYVCVCLCLCVYVCVYVHTHVRGVGWDGIRQTFIGLSDFST